MASPYLTHAKTANDVRPCMAHAAGLELHGSILRARVMCSSAGAPDSSSSACLPLQHARPGVHC